VCIILIISNSFYHFPRIQANIELKKGGGDIVTAPSVAKLDDMVGKQSATNYEFPENENENDSDKVRRDSSSFYDSNLSSPPSLSNHTRQTLKFLLFSFFSNW
jgi:hypothetical protein